MYDVGLKTGNIDTYYIWEVLYNKYNEPNIVRSWYSPLPKEIEFPWLTLAQYKEMGLLQKGCDNLKTKRRVINMERLDILNYNLV